MRRLVQNLLHKDLSYQIHGAAIEVRKDFGPGHKEQLYQKAFAEELKRRQISFEKEKAIKIYSPKDGKYIGLYRPDFIIDKKIIVEIKAEKFVNRDELKRIYDYLRNSEYELAYFINFASSKLFVKRIIYTNDRKHFLKKLLVSISLILVLFSGLKTQAAILYLEPSQGEYHQGDTFIVEARIDTEKECINTVKADLSFPQDILRAVDFSKGNSILTIWLKEPEISQESGLVSFTGGIPGGYCGPLPGEPGRPDLLGRIVFKVRETDAKPERETEAKVEFLETSQVLLNDGFGTLAKLVTKGAIFTILPEKAEVPKEEWQEELAKDNIPPEPFEIEVHQTPEIFEGKYFIIFSTTDKQAGIDYYEVAEQRGIIGGIMRKIDWKKAESPYLLEDQSLQSIIKVKAVDKAGNERIAEYIPPKKPFPWQPIIIGIIILGIVIWVIKKYLFKKWITH